jgi:hypothetical protein
MLKQYLKNIIYIEGGAATKGSKMSKKDILYVFDIINKNFLIPMNLIVEGQDYAKVGSWSQLEKFDETKQFGDIDILVNLKDESFEEKASQLSSLYDKFISQNQSLEFPQLKINKGTGVCSFGIPFDESRFGQVDFFMTKSFSVINIGYLHSEHAQVKGKFKVVALNSLLKLINPEYRWSPTLGLKTTEGYVTDINEISELIGFDFSTLTSLSIIWNKIKELADTTQQENIKNELRKLAKDDIELQQFNNMVK